MSQKHSPDVIFLFLLLITTELILLVTDPDYSAAKFAIYLTNWVYLVLFIENLLFVLILLHRYLKERKTETLPDMIYLPAVYKIYWLAFSITCPMVFTVTSGFWLIANNSDETQHNAIVLSSHFIDWLTVLSTFVMVGHPYRLINIIWVFFFEYFYTIFTILYHICAGKNHLNQPFIYALLDWNKPDIAFRTCAIACSVTFFFHILLFLAHHLKKLIRNKLWGLKRQTAENFQKDEPKQEKSRPQTTPQENKKADPKVTPGKSGGTV